MKFMFSATKSIMLILLVIFVSISLISCAKQNGETMKATQDNVSNIDKATIENVISSITQKYPNADKERIEKAIFQTAGLWFETDGTPKEFEEFCLENFVADSTKLDEMFNSLLFYFESMNGNLNALNLDLKDKMHLDKGELTNLDMLFGAYDPGAHLADDLFTSKIAFIIKLNFPFYSLEEKTELGKNWTRKQWAFARIGDMFTSRVPADIIQNVSNALTTADNYISNYNIFAGNLVDDQMKTYFPADMKLISHWNLRDEIKSQYSKADGLQHQIMLYNVMKHIIYQTIPEEVINKNDFQWNPTTNKLYNKGKEVKFSSEPFTRYKMLQNNYKAQLEIDKYNPAYPTAMARTFELSLEIPEKQVEELFVKLISSPVAKQVGELIAKRLGRPLQPFDIWYDGFKSRSSLDQDELSKITKKKYPNTTAFENDLPNILKKLGFTPEKANFIASKVQVDAARGAGHAWGAEMKTQKSRLRTRIPAGGMDYKGYNIAVHEFGHNTEQTITLHDVDYYSMKGVPNTGFTETWAFIFQARDLDLLGIKSNTPNAEELKTLDSFWSMYEIMGVSLVDMKVWNWMYENPNATPEELGKQVATIAKEVWNKYFAPVFGMKDEPILGIYSHMIDYPLYLPAYPIGHIVEFQIEDYVKGKNIANEMVRMLSQGRLIPNIWMNGAVGNPISVQPILDATSEAVKKLQM